MAADNLTDPATKAEAVGFDLLWPSEQVLQSSGFSIPPDGRSFRPTVTSPANGVTPAFLSVVPPSVAAYGSGLPPLPQAQASPGIGTYTHLLSLRHPLVTARAGVATQPTRAWSAIHNRSRTVSLHE
jgi:alkanesulfonate monooxygenase SsuD/methylene tetrahydromethanopterin reductase-like flavin-dependent oxidoreductase (luciferase family)